MSDDKKKTKKEILGELESIKTLLEGSVKEDDDFEDAPLLTDTISHATAHAQKKAAKSYLKDDDLATEAPLIDPKRIKATRTENEDFDTDDIESLYADIYRSLRGSTAEETDGEEPEEPYPEDEDLSFVDLEFQDIPILDTVVDHDASEHDEGDVDNLEFEEEFFEEEVFEEEAVAESDTADDEDFIEELLDEEPNSSPVATPQTSNQAKSPPSLFDLEDSADEEDETDISEDFDEDALSDDDFDGHTVVAQAQIRTDSILQKTSASQSPKKDEATKNETVAATHRSEDQQSLFEDSDAEIAVDSETHSATTASDSKTGTYVPDLKSHQQFTQHALELSKKTENPFLPKHIRDRLQASRVSPEIYKPVLDNIGAATSATKPVSSEPATRLSKAGEAEKLVDDIVKAYLPKIEAELRQKLLDLVKKS